MKVVDSITGNVGMVPDSDLVVSATAAAGSIVTATLPAVAGQFHRISAIVIERFAAAVLVPAATPTVVTTTNLPGTLAFTLPADALAQGAVDRASYLPMGNAPLKASAAGTASTIVAPATTNVIWRVNVYYTTAP